MDISNFMSWFITQVLNIFTWLFNLLDSITFAGTSLLKVIVTIIILSALIPVLLTIGKNDRISSERSRKVKNSKERNDTNE